MTEAKDSIADWSDVIVGVDPSLTATAFAAMRMPKSYAELPQLIRAGCFSHGARKGEKTFMDRVYRYGHDLLAELEEIGAVRRVWFELPAVYVRKEDARSLGTICNYAWLGGFLMGLVRGEGMRVDGVSVSEWSKRVPDWVKRKKGEKAEASKLRRVELCRQLYGDDVFREIAKTRQPDVADAILVAKWAARREDKSGRAA